MKASVTAAGSCSSSSSSPSNNEVDIWSWLLNLPPLHEWKTNTISITICSTTNTTTKPPSLNLSVNKTSTNLITLSITVANLNIPIISIWTSKPIKIIQTHPTNYTSSSYPPPTPLPLPLPSPPSSSSTLLNEDSIQSLLVNIIQDVLDYGPYGGSHQNNLNSTLPRYGSTFNSHLNVDHYITTIKIPSYYKSNPTSPTDISLKGIFTLSIFILVFLVCIYEAPTEIRTPAILELIKDRFGTRGALSQLMRMLGSNLEEQWMRSLNLGITNWRMELSKGDQMMSCRNPLYSFAMSTYGMWKVRVYCPVIAMEVENSSSSSGGLNDEQLMMSLNYHQLEGVIQLNYKVVVREKWIDLMVNIDNIRLDVVRLVSEKLLEEKGVGGSEKHFPSRISIQITPTPPADLILSVSVSKSSDNPIREIESEKTLEGTFEAASPALKVTAGETTTTTLKPWKFEESAVGNSGNLSWFLHDIRNGKEVFSSKPPVMARILFNPKAWFRNRYSQANRPFTRRGGVVFAGDEYGETVCWKIDKRALGSRMEWEVRVCIGVTYWPNKHRTLYNETRRAEFRDLLELTLN